MSENEKMVLDGTQTTGNEAKPVDLSGEANANLDETTEKPSQEEQTSLESVVALLKEEIKKLQDENANLKDSWARSVADFQNLKRRTAMEYASIKRESVKNFVLKILTPLDNLERVIVPNPSPEVQPFLDGVKMILNEFRSTLEKEGIQVVEALGKPFDPSLMEAIASEEREDINEEIVLEVYRTGYQFQENNEKFPLRPAMVKVGKPKI
jgi:molecular chaperone GrpE